MVKYFKKIELYNKKVQIKNEPVVGRIGNKNVELTEGKIEEFLQV